MRQNNINCTHYFSTYQIFFTFSCGEFFPHDNLSCGEFLHLTICHVDKFLHMTKNFSTGTARGARDKYEVCTHLLSINRSPIKRFPSHDRIILWPPCHLCRLVSPGWILTQSPLGWFATTFQGRQSWGWSPSWLICNQFPPADRLLHCISTSCRLQFWQGLCAVDYRVD